MEDLLLRIERLETTVRRQKKVLCTTAIILLVAIGFGAAEARNIFAETFAVMNADEPVVAIDHNKNTGLGQITIFGPGQTAGAILGADSHGGFLKILNAKSKAEITLQNLDQLATLGISNNDGDPVVTLMVNKKGDGLVGTLNKNGKVSGSLPPD